MIDSIADRRSMAKSFCNVLNLGFGLTYHERVDLVLSAMYGIATLHVSMLI